MRIISGEFKGRKLTPPRDFSIRPTSDRIRENLFNILGARVRGAQFLDLFCGTGACGIEALSRGAAYAVFVDLSQEAMHLVKKNLKACKAETHAQFISGKIPDVLTVRPMPPFDIIFADPPYAFTEWHNLFEVICTQHLLVSGGMLIIESSSKTILPESFFSLHSVDHRIYGDNALTFFS